MRLLNVKKWSIVQMFSITFTYWSASPQIGIILFFIILIPDMILFQEKHVLLCMNLEDLWSKFENN